jgi:hypothetical protein
MRALLSLLCAGVLLAVPAASPGQSYDPGTYVLFGAERVTVGNAARIVNGNVGSNGSIAFRSGALVEAAPDLAADRVTGAPRVIVHGDVFYNVLDPRGATLHGATAPLLALPILTLPPPPVVVPGALDLIAQPGAQRLVPAGAN